MFAFADFAAFDPLALDVFLGEERFVSMESASWYVLVLVKTTCVRGRGGKAVRHCHLIFALCLTQRRRQSLHCHPCSLVGVVGDIELARGDVRVRHGGSGKLGTICWGWDMRLLITFMMNLLERLLRLWTGAMVAF